MIVDSATVPAIERYYLEQAAIEHLEHLEFTLDRATGNWAVFLSCGGSKLIICDLPLRAIEMLT